MSGSNDCYPVSLKTPQSQCFHGPRRRLSLASAFRILFCAAAIAPGQYVFAQSGTQSAPAAKASATKTKDKPVSPADVELRNRVEAADAAHRLGEPASVARANERLIALGLREMGELRLYEAAYPQAIELYRRSLDFEELSDTRVDLAIAELDANHTDEALSESERALQVDPRNPRAFTVHASVWIKKQEYEKAAAELSRAVEIDPDLDSQYSLGMCLLQTKDPKEKERAAAVFERMVQTSGDSGSLHVLFGRAYRDADDLPSAIREFQRAIAIDPRTQHAHYFLGLAQLALNEWKPTPEARSEFAEELKYYPRDYLANYMEGFLASGDRNYEVADRYLKTATEINPDWPETWLYMGLDAYAQANMKRAEECFRKAIALTGDDESRSNYQIRRAYVDLGRILVNSGRAQESEVYLTKARELQNKTMEQGQQSVSAMAVAGGAGSAAAIVPLNPQNEKEAAPIASGNTDPFARVDASVVARSNLTKEQRAAADSQENRLRSVLGLGFNDLATSEAIRGEYLAALGHYQEAERWDTHIPGLARNLGLSAYRANNYPEAIRGLSGALDAKPGDNPLRALLGMADFGAEKFADAAKVFAPLGAPGMRDSTVGYAWATSLARINEPKKAGAVLSEFEKTNRSRDTQLMVGQLWIEIGDYARAVATLHAALQADPALPKAHYFAGQADIRWQHWQEAAAEFQAELALVPGDADAKYNLGFVWLQLSKIDEAATLFAQVIAAAPDHANAQYQMGKILLDRGQVKDAVEHLETATRLSPQTDYMHYQLQAAYRKESRIADADRELELYKELKAKQRDRDRASIPVIQSP
jgi:tetratricopeptide (TPR) repeat protein